MIEYLGAILLLMVYVLILALAACVVVTIVILMIRKARKFLTPTTNEVKSNGERTPRA